jgi:hypothetical protein
VFSVIFSLIFAESEQQGFGVRNAGAGAPIAIRLSTKQLQEMTDAAARVHLPGRHLGLELYFAEGLAEAQLDVCFSRGNGDLGMRAGDFQGPLYDDFSANRHENWRGNGTHWF